MVCVYAGRRHGSVRSSGRLSDGAALWSPWETRSLRPFWPDVRKPAILGCTGEPAGFPQLRRGRRRAWHMETTSTTFCRSGSRKRLSAPAVVRVSRIPYAPTRSERTAPPHGIRRTPSAGEPDGDRDATSDDDKETGLAHQRSMNAQVGDSGACSVDLGGTYYNTKHQVEALETLLRKLPDPTTPAPPPLDRPKPRRARQLDAE
jgi:hypothetical protein